MATQKNFNVSEGIIQLKTTDNKRLLIAESPTTPVDFKTAKSEEFLYRNFLVEEYHHAIEKLVGVRGPLDVTLATAQDIGELIIGAYENRENKDAQKVLDELTKVGGYWTDTAIIRVGAWILSDQPYGMEYVGPKCKEGGHKSIVFVDHPILVGNKIRLPNDYDLDDILHVTKYETILENRSTLVIKPEGYEGIRTVYGKNFPLTTIIDQPENHPIWVAAFNSTQKTEKLGRYLSYLSDFNKTVSVEGLFPFLEGHSEGFSIEGKEGKKCVIEAYPLAIRFYKNESVILLTINPNLNLPARAVFSEAYKH